MPARVAVVADRARIATALVDALTRSPHVESCVVHEHGAIDAIVLSQFDTLVYSALPASSSTTGPDVAAARALFARLASAPLTQAVIISSAAVYTPSHQNAGLVDETTFLPQGKSAIADGWQEVERPESSDRRALGCDADCPNHPSSCGGARRRRLFQPSPHRPAGDYVSRSRSDHPVAQPARSCRRGHRRDRTARGRCLQRRAAGGHPAEGGAARGPAYRDCRSDGSPRTACARLRRARACRPRPISCSTSSTRGPCRVQR